MEKRNKLQRGMTLVEIMVVITIMGLIMGVVAMTVVDRLNDAKRDTAKMDIATFESALELYYAQKGRYPDTEGGLKTLLERRLIKKLPNDPWDQPYVYVLSASGQPVITSYGADEKPGGEGIAEDISSAAVR